MGEDAQVFGPPRERDTQIDALEETWLETKAKYQKLKNPTDTQKEAYRADKAEFVASREAWRRKADVKRGVS